MKIKITRRDIAFFFLGIFAFFLFDIIYNWDQAVEAFMRGYHEGSKMENYLDGK